MIESSSIGAQANPWPSGSLLARLSPALRNELLRRSRRARFTPGAHLLRQGARDRHALVLIDGSVKVHIVDASGVDTVLAVRRLGEVVGELAALTGEPRTASVVAMGRVHAGVVLGSVLVELVTKYPDLARELIRTQAHRLEWANRRRVDFAARPARVKIARVLADLAGETHSAGVMRVELSQRELASLVGIALNTAEQALRKLSDDGLVVRQYRAVLVLDLPRLKEVADADADFP
ncbi:Crp/Fnr family transcriptional regulator [Pseudonocardia sichuanensis]